LKQKPIANVTESQRNINNDQTTKTKEFTHQNKKFKNNKKLLFKITAYISKDFNMKKSTKNQT
jgi:hypothetical protein